jgi:ATP-dependent protease ClpP protease subunit
MSFKIKATFNKADELPVEVMIYQDIGNDPFDSSAGFTAKDFQDALKGVPRNRALHVRVNSAGGNVWDGLAIKTLINEWPGKKTASIDGMAASVASWLCCDKSIEVSAPRHAQMFIHDAWGLCAGNAADMTRQAGDLEKTSDQIAAIYANKTGGSVSEWRERMLANSLFTAEEANKLGLIDKLTDDEPVSNFTDEQLQNMKSKLAILNKSRPSQGNQQNNNENTISMNRKQMEALLNKLGIKFEAAATDEQLNKLLENYNAPEVKPKNAASKEDGDEEKPKNAPKPKEGEDTAKLGESAEFKAATANANKAAAGMNKFLANQRKQAIQNKLTELVAEGKITTNSTKNWLTMAEAATEDAEGVNPVLNQLESLPAANLPGIAPLNIELGESDTIADLDRNVQALLKPANYLARNSRGPENMAERIAIGSNSKNVARLINRLKKYDRTSNKTRSGVSGMTDELPEMIGPLREAWDKFASGSGPRNANTMSAPLLRQVILSETMRAFRRQFASLEIFAHNFQSVPLEGTNYIEVPYYPLDTVASTEFTYANGYVVAPNAQTLNKQIYVGGKGDGVATPGSGRKYKALQFSAYEIRRQPWLDVQKLSVMAGEQLAIDVRGDIFAANINAANFAQAIWTGAANGFDHTVVGNVLLQAAIAAFWPLRGRNVVLAPSYYTNLAIDPAITPLLAIGTTDVLREGIVGGLYGFENIIHDPKIPVANYIRGGDGAVVAGTDPNLAGFMAWPSAVLIATAPIMPPPGVLKKLVAYEQITDDQTGLAFTYQFFGNELANVDNEIIECTYGSGVGELAALFRLTSAGN